MFDEIYATFIQSANASPMGWMIWLIIGIDWAGMIGISLAGYAKLWHTKRLPLPTLNKEQ